jgi:hypothetical protein
MPLVRFDEEKITFTFDEANRLVAYMEQIGSYGGSKTGKTAFQVMESYDVLTIFSDLHDIVKAKYDD